MNEKQITFEELVKHSPMLREIRREAQGWYQHPDRWNTYELLKSKMCTCVGYVAYDGLPLFMYTREAYDVAHRAIFKEGQDLSEPKEEVEEM